MSAFHATFVVPRLIDRKDDNTVAVVTVTSESRDWRLNGGAFKQWLIEQLTVWAQTPAGRQAWDNSTHDFNVGDLNYHQDDPALVSLLRQHGVTMKITVYCGGHDWQYDDVLIDE